MAYIEGVTLLGPILWTEDCIIDEQLWGCPVCVDEEGEYGRVFKADVKDSVAGAGSQDFMYVSGQCPP